MYRQYKLAMSISSHSSTDMLAEHTENELQTADVDSKNEKIKVFVVGGDDANLQDAFLKYKKMRQKELWKVRRKRRDVPNEVRLRAMADPDRMWRLRMKFVEQAKKYFGVPYGKKYWKPEEPEYTSRCFLDCCGLVRRVMRDLRKDFGFRIGPWNQAYMCDTLPVTIEKEEDMKPGDLVFISATYYNTKMKKQPHKLTHVEIWAGDGPKSIGSRWHRGKVQVFDSYRFTATSYHSEQYIFKSLDTWLMGICRSHCPQHTWKTRAEKFNPAKKSIFRKQTKAAVEEDGEDEPDESAGDSTDTEDSHSTRPHTSDDIKTNSDMTDHVSPRPASTPGSSRPTTTQTGVTSPRSATVPGTVHGAATDPTLRDKPTKKKSGGSGARKTGSGTGKTGKKKSATTKKGKSTTKKAEEGSGVQTADGSGVQTTEGSGIQTAEGSGVQTAEGSGVQTPEGSGVQTAEDLEPVSADISLTTQRQNSSSSLTTESSEGSRLSTASSQHSRPTSGLHDNILSMVTAAVSEAAVLLENVALKDERDEAQEEDKADVDGALKEDGAPEEEEDPEEREAQEEVGIVPDHPDTSH